MAQAELLRILSIPSGRGIWRNHQSIKGKAALESVAFPISTCASVVIFYSFIKKTPMDPLTKISNTVSKVARYYLLVVLLVPFVAVGLFSIGPIILVIPAIMIAFGPSRPKQEARSKSLSLSLTIGITTFGAYLLAFLISEIVKAVSRGIGAPIKLSEVFITTGRTPTVGDFTPTSIGNSLQSAVMARDVSKIDFFSFLYTVEYTSMAMMIPLSLLLVLRMGSVRTELKRGHERFAQKNVATPVWIGMWVSALAFWFVIYKMNYHTFGGGRRSYSMMFFAPVSGSFFLLMLTSALLFLRFKVLDYLFQPSHEISPPQDVIVQRFGETDRAINTEEQNLREIFKGGRITTPIRVSVPSRRLREGKIKVSIDKVTGFRADFENGKYNTLRWVAGIIAFAYLLYAMGVVTSEGIHLERFIRGEM
jgi:hypothetical protein